MLETLDLDRERGNIVMLVDERRTESGALMAYAMTLHKTCQQWRRLLVSGRTVEGSYQRWVTRQCNLWLEDDEENRRGRCRQCIDGWTHPENYPVEASQETTHG